jgi:hypothetical protein
MYTCMGNVLLYITIATFLLSTSSKACLHLNSSWSLFSLPFLAAVARSSCRRVLSSASRMVLLLLSVAAFKVCCAVAVSFSLPAVDAHVFANTLSTDHADVVRFVSFSFAHSCSFVFLICSIRFSLLLQLWFHLLRLTPQSWSFHNSTNSPSPGMSQTTSPVSMFS